MNWVNSHNGFVPDARWWVWKSAESGTI